MLIKESYVDVKTKYDTQMRIFIYHPLIPHYPEAKFPGVVVYSEIYQVTGPVSRFAKDIAGQGYIVAAPSVYHNFEGPEPLKYDVEGTDKGNKYKIEKPLESYDEDNKLTIDYLLNLKTCNGKIGTTGMCLGGHLAVRGSLDNRVSSVVAFFPTDMHTGSLAKGGDDTIQRINESRAEIILIFGVNDNHVPPNGRDLIRATFRQKNVNFSFFELAGAQHAFVRDESSKGRYDSAITKACFEFLFELFHRTLVLDLGERDSSLFKIENVC